MLEDIKKRIDNLLPTAHIVQLLSNLERSTLLDIVEAYYYVIKLEMGNSRSRKSLTTERFGRRGLLQLLDSAAKTFCCH